LTDRKQRQISGMMTALINWFWRAQGVEHGLIDRIVSCFALGALQKSSRRVRLLANFHAPD
jgi:hypothetical protein